MQTRETKETTPSKRREPGILIAAAVFAVVVIIGIAVVSIGITGGDAPPADTPTTTEAPPTTTEAPPTTQAAPTTQVPPTTAPTTSADDVSAEDQALAEAFVAVFNEGDAEAWLALWSAPAGFSHTILGTTFNTDAVFLQDRIVWGAGFDEEWTLESCERMGDRVSCRVSQIDALTDALGVRSTSVVWSFVPTDGKLDEVRQSSGGLVGYASAALAFQEWVDVTHPAAGDLLFAPSRGQAWVYTAEVLATALELLPEYVASLGG